MWHNKFVSNNRNVLRVYQFFFCFSCISKDINAYWQNDFQFLIHSSFLQTKNKPKKKYGHWYRHTPRNNPEVQYAFKISMTHWIVQFALRIAVRSVLHRCASLDIHCWKLYFIIIPSKKIEVQIIETKLFNYSICSRIFINLK